jgi:acyl carrier protein
MGDARASILASLTDIFRAHFGDDHLVLEPSTSARDIAGWDSAQMVLLVIAVEERFGIHMRSREIDALNCVGDWIDLIERDAAL